MLRLTAIEHGNVVLSDDGLEATCGTRKKATAQAILKPCLQEGITFIMTLWGTGVVKIAVFKTMNQAKDWYISGLTFPSGSTRMRTQQTNYLAVSVFCDRLVFTSIDQLQPSFSVKTKSLESILAFDVESGDVGINIGQLSHYGIPVPINQRDLFEDHSPYLRRQESENGSTIHSVSPNPLSLCQLADLVLSPGDVLKILVTSTRKLKDTGAYIRLWLLTEDSANEYIACDEEDVCGHIQQLQRSTTEEWYLRVDDNEILLLNKTGSITDRIIIHTDITKMRLAFELYKATVSDIEIGANNINHESAQVPSRPYSSAPRPHLKGRRLPPPVSCPQCGDPKHETETAASQNPYLTPIPVYRNTDELRQAGRSPEWMERDGAENLSPPMRHGQDRELDDGGYLMTIADRTTCPRHAAGQPTLPVNPTGSDPVYIYQSGSKAKSNLTRLEVLSHPVQESILETAETEQTELKTIWESTGTGSTPSLDITWYRPGLTPKPKVTGHGDTALDESGGFPNRRADTGGVDVDLDYGGRPEGDEGLECDCLFTYQHAATPEEVAPPFHRKEKRLSSYAEDEYHKTYLKMV